MSSFTMELPVVSTAVLAPAPSESVAYLERVLRVPFLKAAFGGAIGYSSVDYAYNPIDVIPRLDQGVLSFELQEARAQTQWNTLKHLCTIITCAANDHNPFELSQANNIPLTVPAGKFESIQMDPLLLPQFLIQTKVNPLLRRFASREEVAHEVQIVNDTIKAYIEWIAMAMQTSLAQGVDSHWNWGAYFGLTWGAFMEYVSGIHDVRSVKASIPPPSVIFDIGSIERTPYLVNNDHDVGEQETCTELRLHPQVSTAAKKNQFLEGRVLAAIRSTGPLEGFDENEVFIIRAVGKDLLGIEL
ncbi:hypothetical protein JR316_0009483 [Psilocybe cubensis]|uniref:Uncharacterized protein n=2 Tax=Psilocybe cubensis TaxID=181762 RepID=A0A8H8CE46_PSICU|nr:hypothetical protein JR316_0009483 [Psilocybe cubensis]KAH9477279.1 hypothetical protein JR316_0009483 [Psilocybe cubensis]